MSYKLCQFLLDIYETHTPASLRYKPYTDISIQIDDQDDNDKLNEFCNIFVTVKQKNYFKVELIGNFPVTKDLSDFAESCKGYLDPVQGKLALLLHINQIECLLELSEKIRRTSFLGPIIYNQNWIAISSRTISSLYRFVRIIKEYNNK